MSKLDSILDEYGEELLEIVEEHHSDPVHLLKVIQENGATYKQQIKALMLELMAEEPFVHPEAMQYAQRLRQKVEAL